SAPRPAATPRRGHHPRRFTSQGRAAARRRRRNRADGMLFRPTGRSGRAAMGKAAGLCDNRASGFLEISNGRPMCAREDRMPSPKKLSHLVLQTNRREAMIEWYCKVLGAQLLHQNKQIAFISYDDEHHRVAFIDPGPLADKAPQEGKTAKAGGEVGLHHVAFTMGSLDELADQYLHLKEQGIRPHRCVNHGDTTAMYSYD